jgi:hypothetical protein
MSEASGGGGSSRAEMERRLVQRSLEDEDFRQRLLEDPRATMEQELGIRLPAEVQVQAVEETADSVYLVLPFRSTEAQEASELSDRELEEVAGGINTESTCQRTAAAICTIYPCAYDGT